ncbi:MAG: hypothetical protein ABR975_16170 [Vulcanimicrobiaceae bacterium]|jgi:hypothetical protein
MTLRSALCALAAGALLVAACTPATIGEGAAALALLALALGALPILERYRLRPWRELRTLVVLALLAPLIGAFVPAAGEAAATLFVLAMIALALTALRPRKRHG